MVAGRSHGVPAVGDCAKRSARGNRLCTIAPHTFKSVNSQQY